MCVTAGGRAAVPGPRASVREDSRGEGAHIQEQQRVLPRLRLYFWHAPMDPIRENHHQLLPLFPRVGLLLSGKAI